MSLQDMELNVGGVKFKGVYIAILFSFATTIGGGIWAASDRDWETHISPIVPGPCEPKLPFWLL